MNSTTKAEQIKRYCIRENRMCEYANDHGYCEKSGCAYQFFGYTERGEANEGTDHYADIR